jgi:hypothetical protein
MAGSRAAALELAKLVLGGAERDRTDDLRLAKPALSQLSYSPRCGSRHEERVGQGRLELPTSRLSGVRSNHLSYWPSQVTASADAWPTSPAKGRTGHAGFGCFRVATGHLALDGAGWSSLPGN